MSDVQLREWAERHRVRVRRDEDNALHIPGKLGSVYVYGSGRLGVAVMETTVRRWRFRRRKCEAAGMEMRQGGDTEGAFTFDPDDDEQAAVAIEVAGVHQKRRLSEEQLRRLAEIGTVALRAHRLESDGANDSGSPTAQKGHGQGRTGEHPSGEELAA